MNDRGWAERRAVWAGAVLCAGVVLGRAAPAAPSWWWLAVAAACAGAALALRAGPARAALAASLLCFGAGWTVLRTGEAPARDIARALSHEPALITVEGMVLGSVERRGRPGRLARYYPFGGDGASFELAVSSARSGDEDRPARGVLLVHAAAGAADGLRAGDLVRLRGMAAAVRPARNPGEEDHGAWARVRGRSGSVRVEAASMIGPARHPPGPLARAEAAARRHAETLRRRAAALLDAGDDAGEARALLRALLLGDRSPSSADLRDSFMRLGIAHVLSISGLHLMALAWAVLLSLRLLGSRPRTEALVTAAIVALYLVVIPVRAPVLRAALMLWVLLAAEASGRRYGRVTVLAWVMAAVLIWRPTELFSAGFQLSFGVVAALMLLAAPVRERLFGPRPERDTLPPPRAALEPLKDAAAAAVAAWAVSAPIIAHHIGVVSPLGIPATVLLVPAVTLLLGLGYGAMALSALWPGAADLLRPALDPLAGAVAWCVRMMDGWGLSALYLPAVSPWWTAAAVALAAWWMWPAGVEGTGRAAAVARWGASLLCALWLSAEMLTTGLPRTAALRLDAIDVGDGSCYLLRVRYPSSGRTESVLWDCGSLDLAVGERTIPRAVRALGAGRVRTVVITHPDIDHYAGVIDVLAPLGVRRVVVGEAFVRAAETRAGAPAAVLSELRARGVAVAVFAAGDELAVGGAALRFISPPRGSRWSIDNDASLVAVIDAPAEEPRRLLLSGDIGRAALVALMTDRPDLRADVIELPHHGSWNTAADAFVRMLDPAVVVQSTGPSRLNDERWDGARAGRRWLVTARDGAVSVLIDRDGRIIDAPTSQRPAPPPPR